MITPQICIICNKKISLKSLLYFKQEYYHKKCFRNKRCKNDNNTNR